MNLALPEADLTPEERDAFFQRVARAVCRRRLEVPAVLALELHRPLTFLGSQAVAFLTPTLAPALGWANLQKLYLLLEDRSNLDRLLEEIERQAREGDAGGGEAKDALFQDLRPGVEHG